MHCRYLPEAGRYASQGVVFVSPGVGLRVSPPVLWVFRLGRFLAGIARAGCREASPARRKGGPRGLSAVLSNPARPALRVIQLFRTRRNRMNRQGARTETIFGKRPTPAGYCKASFNFRVSSGTGRLCEAAGVRRKGRPNFVRSSSRLARPERTPFQPSGTSMALKKSCRSGTPSVFLTGMYCYSVCRKPVFTAPASGS